MAFFFLDNTAKVMPKLVPVPKLHVIVVYSEKWTSKPHAVLNSATDGGK
jgi:hypothetical protein